MKKCPYCGKEYSDEATNCAIDNELLLDNQLAKAEEQEAKKDEPYLTFPDYKWSARDAWKCLGAILILTLTLGLILGITLAILHFPHSTFKNWINSGFGDFWGSIFTYAAYLLPAIYFARTKTLATFVNGFGLDCKISKYAWFGVIMALVIRCHGHFYGWGKISTPDVVFFENTVGFTRYFFLVPLLLLAPVIEEVVNRGFLYKAFRGSYSLEISMALLVLLAIVTHWPQCHNSPSATFSLGVLTIVQCYLREKSGSLWDCILCHFVFNASLLFIAVFLS
jgi:membrane protease YdiL (CAAX protease family)